VEAFIATKTREGRAVKSILNYVGLLHSIFAYAQKRGWASQNPCKLIDKPRGRATDADIRFLDAVELGALLREIPEDALGSTERALYLTAAMTGLRQGELLALRWRDIDWVAGRVRVRRNFVRGEFGTPKSHRSSRSVPLADRVSAALERHHQASVYDDDDDLVFGHPELGKPLDRSKLLKRFKAAARRAGLRDLRFHDLRHTFGTKMAGAGVPMRTLQEWMGHRDFKTTLIYADYAPSAHERQLVESAFGLDTNLDTNLSETGEKSNHQTARNYGLSN
jgi:integrase